MKYVFVSGGCVANIGKGTLSASLGVLLQSFGYSVTFLKVEPYLNYNSGLLEPSEHGETFVLSDGTETDLDLGNYQRFCSILLDSDNTISLGKIFYDAISRERSGTHNGKTLRIQDEICKAIRKRLQLLSENPVKTVGNENSKFKIPDVIIIELGGFINNEETNIFLKAFSRFFIDVKEDDKCFININKVVDSNPALGLEALVNSLNHLFDAGIKNNVLFYRSKQAIEDSISEKISKNSKIDLERIFWLKECTSKYELPIALYNQGLFPIIQEKLQLNGKKVHFLLHQKFGFLTCNNKIINIGLITRYSGHDQSYESLEEAITIAGKRLGVDINIIMINYIKLKNNDKETLGLLHKVDGIVIPGGFGSCNVETKIKVAEFARTNKIPCLGICLGFQIMVIEFARSVLKLEYATSEEFDPQSKDLVIKKFVGKGTADTSKDILLGEYCIDHENNTMREIHKSDTSHQIFRHSYTVNLEYENALKKAGMVIEGIIDNRIVAMQIPNGSFYFGVQYHPELNSRPESVNPIFLAYVEAIIKNGF
ncbi:hypothetical protein GINT2_000234 [Glugoides intestinalis]